MTHQETYEAALADLKLLMPHWWPSVTELQSLLRLARTGFDQNQVVAIAIIARTWR